MVGGSGGLGYEGTFGLALQGRGPDGRLDVRECHSGRGVGQGEPAAKSNSGSSCLADEMRIIAVVGVRISSCFLILLDSNDENLWRGCHSCALGDSGVAQLAARRVAA